MNQYLLLRDNKQTGPYTAKELSAKGLKPYDLVWLEGKSAAWRYPGEIEELKSFSPVIGEQASQQVAAETNAVQETEPVSKQVEQSSKHIYVNMAAGMGTTNTQKKAAAVTYIISEEDDELNSGLLKGYNSRKKEDEEINNGYMNDYESRKAVWSKNKTDGSAMQQTVKPVEKVAAEPRKAYQPSSTTKAPKGQFDLKTLLAGSGQYLQNNKNLTRILVAAVLMLGGVVIGLIINSGHKQPDTQALESLVKELQDKQKEKASTTVTARPEMAQKKHGPREAERVYTDNGNTGQETQSATASANNPASESGIRHAVIKKENNVVAPPPSQPKSIAVPVSNTSTPSAETTPAVIEPNQKPIDKEVIEKARKNIYEQVHIEASAFKVGLLGGISDLDITVQNTSLYVLDQVAVEIKYFGPEKKLVKTQTLLFNNVPPGKRKTLEVPSTRRGITIDYSITTINSKALGLAQNGF